MKCILHIQLIIEHCKNSDLMRNYYTINSP